MPVAALDARKAADAARLHPVVCRAIRPSDEVSILFMRPTTTSFACMWILQAEGDCSSFVQLTQS